MSRNLERQFLCTSPKAKFIMAMLESYVRLSEDNITLLEDNYTVYYMGELSKERLNELRMYGLGCYDTLRFIQG